MRYKIEEGTESQESVGTGRDILCKARRPTIWLSPISKAMTNVLVRGEVQGF